MAIERWLATESCWALGRPFDHIKRSIDNSLEVIRDEILATGVCRILLATNDAHGVYLGWGSTSHAEPEKWMELTTRRIGVS